MRALALAVKLARSKFGYQCAPREYIRIYTVNSRAGLTTLSSIRRGSVDFIYAGREVAKS